MNKPDTIQEEALDEDEENVSDGEGQNGGNAYRRTFRPALYREAILNMM